jgi:hypothetical protein
LSGRSEVSGWESAPEASQKPDRQCSFMVRRENSKSLVMPS